MKPSVSISFLAFHTKVAMVTETASVRLFSPALDKVTSDLTLSVSLVRVMVLAVALIALSISSKIPATVLVITYTQPSQERTFKK